MDGSAPKVFVSVGSRFLSEQQEFVDALFSTLRAIGLDPHAVGVTDFSHKNPLKHIEELMRACDGSVIVAFERIYIDAGTEKRNSPLARPVSNAIVPTPWNQIEAAMAYTLGHPLLVLVEEGCRSEGLLEEGYDWYVQRLPLTPQSLADPTVVGQMGSWRKAVVERAQQPDPVAPSSVEQLTLGDVLRRMQPSHIAGFIGLSLAWAGVVAAVVANLS